MAALPVKMPFSGSRNLNRPSTVPTQPKTNTRLHAEDTFTCSSRFYLQSGVPVSLVATCIQDLARASIVIGIRVLRIHLAFYWNSLIVK